VLRSLSHALPTASPCLTCFKSLVQSCLANARYVNEASTVFGTTWNQTAYLLNYSSEALIPINSAWQYHFESDPGICNPRNIYRAHALWDALRLGSRVVCYNARIAGSDPMVCGMKRLIIRFTKRTRVACSQKRKDFAKYKLLKSSTENKL
jgi:hypothetical protein